MLAPIYVENSGLQMSAFGNISRQLMLKSIAVQPVYSFSGRAV
jgi:hypothetical protein